MLRSRAEVTERLTQLLNNSVSPDLAEVALLVSAHGRPDLVDVEGELGRFDTMAEHVGPEASLDDLIELLFVDLDFRGDVDDYYSPDNSRLDVVVRRRRGIPLTLAVITCAVGARAGIGLVPVGLPGHVVVSTADGTRFVDVFDKGRSLSREDCAKIIMTLHPGMELTQSMLSPMAPRAVAVRMLNNLVGVHQRRGRRSELMNALALREQILVSQTERDRAGGAEDVASALAAEGKLVEAAEQLERAAQEVDATVASGLLARATRLRARLN